MFKIYSVNPTGLFSFGMHRTIRVDKRGSVLLDGINLDKKGGSNGSGKTSFLSVIPHILYGKNPSGEIADAVINRFLGKYFGRVVLTDKDDVKWRITDVRKWRRSDKYPTEKFEELEEPSEIHNSGLRYSGTDVFLERWDPSKSLWIDERSSNRETGDTRLDLKATRKKIVDILKIDYDQYMSIVYLAQQQTLKFIAGTHKDRLQVFTELSDLRQWDSRVDSIREDISTKESEKSRYESKLDGMGHMAQSRPEESDKKLLQSAIDVLTLQLEKCDEEILDIDTQHKLWTSNLAKIDLQLKTIKQSIATTDQVKAMVQRNIDANAKLYSEDCFSIRSTQKPTEIAKLNTDISETNGKIAARRFDLEQLIAGSGRCPRCRSNVTMDHILRHRELLTMDISAMEAEVVNVKSRLGILESEWESGVLARLDARTTEYKKAADILHTNLDEAHSRLVTYHEEFDSLNEKKTEFGLDPKLGAKFVEQKRLTILSNRSMKEMELNNWEYKLKKFQEHEAAIVEAKSKVSTLAFEIKHLRVLERMFGDKGIKAYKLNNLLSSLNASLDKYIGIITDNTVKVWVTQYREKGDGELTADIQIMVREGHKCEVPLSLYSGGERQQITLAFIGAFWQLASRYGSGVNIICLDEIFGALDDFNTTDAFNYLDHMRMSGKDSIFITTHNQNIKNQVKFDQVWTITKKNHISTLDTGEEL